RRGGRGGRGRLDVEDLDRVDDELRRGCEVVRPGNLRDGYGPWFALRVDDREVGRLRRHVEPATHERDVAAARGERPRDERPDGSPTDDEVGHEVVDIDAARAASPAAYASASTWMGCSRRAEVAAAICQRHVSESQTARGAAREGAAALRGGRVAESQAAGVARAARAASTFANNGAPTSIAISYFSF